ncbi:MAG: hypothetical protein QW407_06865 [Thermofilaceae archaeon]
MQLHQSAGNLDVLPVGLDDNDSGFRSLREVRVEVLTLGRMLATVEFGLSGPSPASSMAASNFSFTAKLSGSFAVKA